MQLQLQTYTSDEMLDKIYEIEYTETKNSDEYEIIVKDNTYAEIIKIMQSISEYFSIEYDRDYNYYEYKVLYNNIVIMIDIENHFMVLEYIDKEINPEDLQDIKDTFLFLLQTP